MIGEYVIINEFDKPCTRLIAQVERVEGETVHARYVTTGTRMTHCSAHVSEVTPVWKFGVMFEIKGGHITAAQVSKSQATYRDGKPRNWQPAGEDARVRLRAVPRDGRRGRGETRLLMQNVEIRVDPNNPKFFNILLNDVKVGWMQECGGLWHVRAWDDAAKSNLFQECGSRETAEGKVRKFFEAAFDFSEVIGG